VIAIFVAVPHFVAVPIRPVAISVAIAGLSVCSATVIAVMVVSSAVVSVMVVPYRMIAEAWVIPEASFILSSPFPILSLALTVQSVVFDIVIPALSQPLSVIRVIRSVIAAVPAVAVIGVVSIPVLCASRRDDRPDGQS